MIEQPRDRSRTRPGNTILDFLDLFGHVNVDWSVFRHGYHRSKLVRGDRSQTVRRNANATIRQVSHHRMAIIEKPRKAVDSVDKPALAVIGRRTAECRVA
ncbi:hypothetical protein D3C71_1661930 [compost metagenome]